MRLPLLALCLGIAWTAAGAAAAASTSRPAVLVVGGNGFIGSHAVEALVAAGYEVTTANRNSTYFDSAERLRALGVRSVYWDRSRSRVQDAPELVAYLDAHPRLRGVVDFSCYTGAAAEDLASYLARRRDRLQVDWYIYISTDSIYEVCAPKADPVRPTTEGMDDRRPASAAAEAALNALDPYGHGKLEAEEVLRAWQPKSTWAYAFLRVPDVVGPRDTSYRWWFYQLLIKLQARLQVPIPYVADDRTGRRLSLVYAGDIARAVVTLLGTDAAAAAAAAKEEDGDGRRRNLAVNLASGESWTFMEVMGAIAGELGVAPGSLRYALNATTDFPSVKRGPVSVARAQEVLGWEPTPWPQIVRETVAYFEGEAMADPRFQRERQGVLAFAYQQCAKYGKEQRLLELVKETYGVDASALDFSRALNPNDVVLEEEGEGGVRQEL